MSEDELLACIQRVKRRAARRAGGLCRRLLPVREAPAHHRRLRRGDDQLLPVLGRLPARAGAGLHADHGGAHARGGAAASACSISETGWPDQGSAFHGAVPSARRRDALLRRHPPLGAARTTSRSSTSPPSTRPGRSAPRATSAPTGACGTRTASQIRLTTRFGQRCSTNFPPATPSATRATAHGQSPGQQDLPLAGRDPRGPAHPAARTGSCCACTTAACTPNACCR